MSEVVRLTFSIEKPLCAQLEKLIKESHYTNRSEFVRDMIREQIVSRQWKSDQEALGTVTLVYNHHLRRVGEKLTDVQHHHHEQVLAATHVHLSHDLCAEVIIIRGRAGEIRHIADELRQQKGVLHAALSMSTTGKGIA
ncbi:MAG: nickel-responsive transcriptional regulator NikR [Planctomycetota bacterium]|nr:nickel-responsive transcriptional regulator NikR [Planctomycetota bacterium]